MRTLARRYSLCLAIALAICPSGLTAQTPTITVVAGAPLLPLSGKPAVAQVITPSSVISDGVGGFYFSSLNIVYRVGSDGILRITAGTGTTGYSGDGGPATAAQLNAPAALALDPSGNLFIADTSNHRIRRVSLDGVITTIAGSGTPGFTGDGGSAASAQLKSPAGLAVDTAGNIFIADSSNNRIREVSLDGVIKTVAGNGPSGFTGDGGPAISATLGGPAGIALDHAGNLFIADRFNSRIRKMTTDGTITTIAGSGRLLGDGGPATSAMLALPRGVAIDVDNNLFIADTAGNRIRRVTPDGNITTVAGTGTSNIFCTTGHCGGEGGPVGFAEVATPIAIAVDPSGNLFIADLYRVLKVAGGVLTRVAGGGTTSGFSGDGGPATSALLHGATGVALDGSGNLFIADSANSRIRKVTPAGIINPVATTGPILFGRTDVAVNRAGDVFIADNGNDRIHKLTSTGVIDVAGNGMEGFSGDGGPATSARLFYPSGVAVDAAGNLFIADYHNNRIRKVTADGIITTVAGSGVGGFGGDGGPATAAQLGEPSGIAIDDAGNLFIADTDNGRVRKVDTNGIIVTVAGGGAPRLGQSPVISSGDGGPATLARLIAPSAVAVDRSGNVFIADVATRKVAPDGTITTVGPSSWGITLDPAGNLYLAAGDRVLKVTFSGPAAYSLADRGGVSLRSSGTSPSISVGYVQIQPTPGSTTPAGLAIFGFRQNNVLVTEAGVPASALIRSGRFYAEINDPLNTGLAIANPNNQPATILYFADVNGNIVSGTTTIPPNGQTATFLDQSPYNLSAPMKGSFTFNASVPVAAVALRGHTNERGEFLITTLPVADLNLPASQQIVVFPHYADGGGWTTEIILMNTTADMLVGSVRFLTGSGNSSSLADSTYSIIPGGSLKLRTPGTADSISTGSVRIIPGAGTAAPSGVAIFSFRSNGITVAEAGVPASPPGTAFRLYVETSGDFDHATAGAIQTGLAIANMSSSEAAVSVELTKLDGSSTGLTGKLSVPPNGQTAAFLSQIEGLKSLQTGFQGVLRLSSTTPISVVGLRGRYNERGDFLITTTPPVNEASPSSVSPLFFPHIVDSGGYTTQFILFSGQPGSPSSVTLQLFSQSGGALNVTVQ